MLISKNMEESTRVIKKKDGKSTEISVREISNGYILVKEEYEEVDGKWKSNRVETYYKENPLKEEDKEEKNETVEGMKSLMNSLENTL